MNTVKKVEVVERSPNFWSIPEMCVQRMTTKQWRYLLMNELDTFIAEGRLWQMYAKSLGAGVYEVRAKMKNTH